MFFSVCRNMVNKQSVGKFPVFPVCFHTLKPFNWELLILTMPTCCLLLPWLPPKYPEPFRSSGWGSPHPAAKSLQSCPTLCDPVDGSPLGSPVPGILQARILEWVAISFSNAWKWKVKGKSLSSVRLFATPWTAAYQAPPSMGFSRQEYWSGVPLPSPAPTLPHSKDPNHSLTQHVIKILCEHQYTKTNAYLFPKASGL